ncbi:MAG: hypothetical protein CL881_05965 [Dehalococcoidia bacterium]|jgi:Chlorophyll A-B binding protein.|nr:hypothetical protein [Dehalococcoidia bacterium]|tara:strand:- start:643 stop:1071 length:429 start_codon:yes stop_codon:yes gene_type:complete
MSCIAALKPIVAVNTSSNPKTKTKTKTTSSRVPPLRTVDRPNDFLSMAERVNGRAAMIGFTSAVIDEIMTGHSISTQFQENIGLSVAVAALVLIGTAANPKDEGYIQGFWKPETELVNGRLAMIGVLSLILTESLHPHVPLF